MSQERSDTSSPRIVRRVAAATIAVLAVAMAASPVPADAATRSKGQFFVFDSPDCTGGGTAAQVTVPASLGGRDYPPHTTMDIYATDKNTGERFGPETVTTDANGDFCALVVRARPTQWKIDLVEPGSGFTDSKVVTVLPPAVGTTTTAPPITTSPATTSPATTSPATTSPATTTTGVSTTAATTTTAASTTTTTAATTTTVVDSEVVPPIDIEQVPVPPSWTLPPTGSSPSSPLTWGLWCVVVGGLLVGAVRRRPVGRQH